jgi:hypothetical protein
MRSIALRPILIVTLFVIGTIQDAAALGFSDIQGKWCGSISTYTFTRDQLIVHFYDRSPTAYFKVVKYEYTGDAIIVHWLRDGEDRTTRFANFRAKGRQMTQQEAAQTCVEESCPRRDFRRC